MALLSPSSSSSRHSMALVVALLLLMAMAARSGVASLLYDQIDITWGQDHSFFYMDGDLDTLALCLDEARGGSGFASKDAYLYGRFDIDIMLVANNSAGTVATFYLMPDDVPWEYHDEVDLEFLGNSTGEPYTLHTNIYVNGVGGREQQFRLWFDPTTDFHTYSIEWNTKHIIILVDGTPVRVYSNDATRGVAFPTWQRMRLHGSLWNAEEWATQGGRVKTDWTQAPFYAYYRNLRVTPCVPSPGVAWCGDEPPESTWFDQRLDAAALQRMQGESMIYDYCADQKRFKDKGFPKECTTD
ncbi:putative xyloglucan endotransglucosylase/hydrolase protein 25 [Dichanthelium oligosanthes]|uniref:Xyloglucan endotransglucosylase/hydrolase n=1 Tax=Dichanthelium oligosanthes TaxID=888268 RepID=A0A1E5VD69_9POAL|nr:putative xyloglucan endotransglucosylase/hydrolase protein 25 [Dichanthelium oligosanthes]